jgi:hypothetical protein
MSGSSSLPPQKASSRRFGKPNLLLPKPTQLYNLPPEPKTYHRFADGGTRTRTDLSIQRILSPLRLPFRHIGARPGSRMKPRAVQLQAETCGP